MFKKKLSIKAILSAAMASFLFCLCFGESAFATYNRILNELDYGVHTEIFVEDDVSPYKVNFRISLCNEKSIKIDYYFNIEKVKDGYGDSLSFNYCSEDDLENIVLEPGETKWIELKAWRASGTDELNVWLLTDLLCSKISGESDEGSCTIV